ncbi:hypothetical protein M3O96_01225 [Aquiflexum sp. TKW24L]|uniref:hypothetical protein n=1 Tax=Aquiflexum sp. TKW24L TaxID=2942212 RepID=UPI0020BF6BCA|nr:hypothetical protein [Aquiflexum sp. TKW24L]MCL6257689.1 hypothetical protein [Aquiflexum sp. TKW24L]
MFLLLEKQDSLEVQEKHDSLNNHTVKVLLQKQLLEKSQDPASGEAGQLGATGEARKLDKKIPPFRIEKGELVA